MKSIFKKQDALNVYNRLKHKSKSSLMLFQEDIDRAGSKRFYVEDSKKIFEKIKRSAEPHFYEFWSDKTKLCFSVDIDFDTTIDKTDPEILIKNVINAIINGAKKYYDYDYNISDIIVLENDEYMQKMDNPHKYSSHIIFRGLNFESVTVCKDFFLRLDADYGLKKMYVDKAIYNLTCLRLFLNSKMGKNAILVPKKIIINDVPTLTPQNGSNDNQMYEFFLKTLITHTLPTDRTIKIKEMKTSIKQIKPTYEVGTNNIDNINIEHILDNLPNKYYDDYELWYKIGMILYGYYSDKLDTFTIWDNWSQKSMKYHQKEMINKWESFKTENSKLTIGTLIKWAKEENIDNIYKETNQSINSIVESYPIKPIQINMNKLQQSQLTLLSQAKLTPEIYEPLLHNKLIAIQSEKGTGKTSNLFKVMFANNKWINKDTSILFLSSRITFGYKLLGDLKEYGFELYSQIKDQQIYSKRIICQIDSLMRLELDKYDIIIVDECESMARYMTSSHFIKNQKASMIVENLELRIAEATQVFILDADLSDRCINFYKKIVKPLYNQFHVIINNFKPYSKYKLIYSQYASWIRQIRLKIQDNKKIVVATASNNKAKDLDYMLRDYFPEKKILLIHRETSDEDKKNLLLNVNVEWCKYDIIIYTPSVCMGVSFDIENYFDYIFAFGCHESLGSQEWCQMIHRVRSPINKDIYIAIDQYKPFSEQDDVINYQMVEKILCSDYYLTNYDLHNNMIPKKIKRINNQEEAIQFNSLDAGINDDNDDDVADNNNNEITETIYNVNINDKVLYYPYRDEPIYDLYVRNSWEQIENKLNFPAAFFGYAKFKHYQLEFLLPSEEDKCVLMEMKDIRAGREELELEQKINGIVGAEDLDKEAFLTKIRQRDECITQDDKYAIQKYNLRNCYGIIIPNTDIDTDADTDADETLENGYITKDFVAEYYQRDRMKWYRNLSTILSTDDQTTEEKINILQDNQQYESIISNCYLEFTVKNKYAYHYYAITLINLCGFNINNLNIRVDYPNLITNIYNAIGWCDDKKDELSHKYDFKTTFRSLTALSEVEQMKYINRILESQYGLKIKRENNSPYKDNIFYKLDDNGLWDNLLDCNETEGLKKKVKSSDIKQKRNNYKNTVNTYGLDPFEDED